MSTTKSYLLPSIVIGVAALTLIFCLGLRTNDLNIVYVRSGDLVNNYKGMVEARERFQSSRDEKQSNIDSQAELLKQDLDTYDQERPGLSDGERTKREMEFDQRHRALKQYVQEVGQMTNDEEDEMLEGVLNQVNSFVEDYAKERGYDLVLGTTRSGSIVYGIEAIDVTEEVLEALNAHYDGTETN